MTTNSRAETTLAAAEDFSRAYVKAVETLMRSAGDVLRAGLEANPVLETLGALRSRSRCHVPPPCWMPRALGEVHSVVCAGGTASLRIRVTNCRPVESRITAEFAGTEARAEISPETATLGPMERAVLDARVALPAEACAGQRTETLLWIRGCNAHYLRWIVEAGESARGSCHEIAIEDCPDYVHHWYDHFYCDRPCFDERYTDRGH